MDDIKRPKSARSLYRGRQTQFDSFAVGSSRRKSGHRTPHLALRVHLPGIGRIGWGALAMLMVASLVIGIFEIRRAEEVYRLSAKAEALIGPPSLLHAQSLKLHAQRDVYAYNEGYQPSINMSGQNAQPKFSASFDKFNEKRSTVTDPVNQTSVSFTPRFELKEPLQDQNRLIYPLKRRDAARVYSLKSVGFKEDIILNSYQGDTLSFEYELGLAPGTEARLEHDGSLAVYGVSSVLLGNVSTESDKDEELLKKARDNGEKNTLLFRFPAPFIVESGKKHSDAKAWFGLKGSELTMYASGLKGATYPLSIDPSVYVETAAKLMRGNNETNVDFDVDNELIQKGSTTGARFDQWTNTLALNEGRWNGGTAVAGGYIYQVGGMETGSTNMPAISSQQISTRGTAGTTFTMNMPASRPAGDLYIAIIAHDDDSETDNSITPPSGGNWTEYADLEEHAAYWKIGENKGGGNEQASYVWTGASEEWAGVIIRVTGFDSTDPISGSPATGFSDSNSSPTAPSVTPDNNLTLVLRAMGIDTDNPSGSWQPTSHTQVSASSSSSGGNGSAAFALASMNTPPSAGNASGTATFNGLSDAWGASTIAINPQPGATSISDSIYWAHFNPNSKVVESPNPGEGSCSGWCTNIAYNLPDERAGFSLIAYNGFLYAIGGVDSAGAKKDTVYIAKLGANGEPARWHPSDSDKDNWVYWYPSTALSSPRSYMAAVAYNNRMYILGGLTGTSPSESIINTVQYANINPTGTLGSWTSTGMTTLPTARYGHAVQVYNDRMYLIGGDSTLGGSPLSTVHYIKLNTDGTMAGGWQSTNGFTNGRMTWGGNFTTIWGGYLYLSGGCSAVNSSGYCTTIDDTVQLASINADGSLAKWGSIANVTNQRIGYGLVAWRNTLYRVGGCSAQSTSTGSCSTVLTDVDYGLINPDGDASTVSITESSGSGNCAGGDPYDCDLPPAGDAGGQGGHMLSATAIMNGYLYSIGGCTSFSGSNECSQDNAMTGNVVYAAIASDGTLRRPSTCIGSYYGAWCVDSTNRVNGTAGVGAAGVAVFGGRIYVVGGLNGTSGGTDSVYSVEINADGSLAGTWDQQSLSNVGITESVAYTYAYARANPSSAGTYPGNLYVFGGCGGLGAGVGCSNSDYETEVYKCNIETSGLLEEADANDCTTSGQLQIDSDLSAGDVQGLGIHSGTVYANYIYLVGGFSQTESDKDTVIYAKFDNNNDVVAVTASDWIESPNTMAVGRRRGASFGYNGYIYVIGGFDGGTIIDDIEFAKVNVSDGAIGEFNTSAVTINQRWGLSVVVSNSYAYVVGGCNVGSSPSGCTSFEPSIQTFQIYNNESGAPAAYTTSANLFTTDRLGASAAVHDGYIYIAGGCVAVTAGCTDATNNVQYALLDANGAIGSWSNTTAALPADRAFGQLEVSGDALYYIGGQGDSAIDERAEVYYGTPSSGNVSAWTATASLPAARTQHSAAVWNGRIYVTGGLDGSAAAQTTVYASSDQSGGGAVSSWTTTNMTAFSVARSGHTAIAYSNNLYILGGYTGSQYLSDVQFAKVSADGSVGNWSYTTNLPTPIRQGDGFAANGYMYLFGGRSSDNNCESSTLVAPISANTTIASGNNPTGVGEWYETNARYNGDRYGAAAAYYEGKAYLLGGGCGSATVTHGTYAFDTDNDADESAWTFISDNGPDGLNTSDTERSWAHDTNETPSSSVGPTSGQGGDPDGYVYTESSSPAAAGDTFHMTLNQTLDASVYDWDIEFYWNQRGDDNLATVQVQTNENGAGWVTRGTYAQNGPDVGSNGTQIWNQENLDLSSSISNASTQIRLLVTLGSTGNVWHNDFGVDSVTISGTPQTPFTGSDRIVQTALLSQPQVARYSRMIDTDTDVTPTKWLLNGVDNSIGARWHMRYRSSTHAASTWGMETDFGDVTLGQPEDYNPLDGSGANTNTARFYYMAVTIDSSQAYGYPDDVTRGPTITDLSLFFTSDPGKRLRHGKTFTGGEQQPLDTPF